MAKQTINIGTAVNDGTGDPLRTAFDKINDNFDEVYLAGLIGGNLAVDGNTFKSTNTNGNITLDPDGSGLVTINSDLIIAGSVRGDSSSVIQIESDVEILGDHEVTGTLTVGTVTGNLIPSANVTYDLGNSSNRWNDLYLSGTTISLGSITLKDQSGSLAIFAADGTTPASIVLDSVADDSIVNGTSNVAVASNGNVTITIAGSTEATFHSGGMIINDAVSVTGNVSGGNVSGTRGAFTDVAGTLETASQPNVTSVGTLSTLTVTGDITSASGQFIGDGSALTGITASATAAGADTQVQFNDGGTATGGDAGFTYNKTTDAVTVVGNINGGNLVTGGSLSLGGTVVTATAAELNKLDGVTATTTELNYVSGVSSAIQTQLNAKAPTASPTFTGTPAAPTAAVNTNTTQIATTAYVVAQIADDAPTKTGTGASGTWGIDISGTAALATSVTATANNTANETVYITFVDGATGSQGIETDTNLTYNPSTNVLSTTASQAQYADLAEMYSSDQEYEPGTVVILGGEAEVTHSTRSHDTAVAGVVSTAPAYLMNSSLEGVPVALQGRVPCKVLGPVAKGDLLVTSQHDGVAQKLNNDLYRPGCVIGKAVEDIQDTTIKIIEILVGRV